MRFNNTFFKRYSAPHSFMWYGYERFNKTDMVPMSHILDLDALNAGVDKGIRIYDDTLTNLREKTLKGKKWLAYTKPRSKIDPKTKQEKNNWFSFNAIKFHWKKKEEDVVFWRKGSMWMCCAGGDDYTPFIVFNKHLKSVAARLIYPFISNSPNLLFNAIHVRRGGGHTRIDRRTASHYHEYHLKPSNFDNELPLYIATDERNQTWFQPLITEFGYKRLVFWSDLDKTVISNVLENFPKTMHGDVIGFIEQIICGYAVKWAGSDGSTFSFAIAGIRKYPSLLLPK